MAPFIIHSFHTHYVESFLTCQTAMKMDSWNSFDFLGVTIDQLYLAPEYDKRLVTEKVNDAFHNMYCKNSLSALIYKIKSCIKFPD